MTKKIFKILSRPKNVLSVSDLTPDQKKRLYAVFMQYEATQGFIYDRVFVKGFDEWELVGIDNIKRQFVKDHDAELGDYERVLALSAVEKGKFYAILGENVGLKKELKELMSTKGMGFNTTFNRFAEDNWKVWEKMGILSILEEFINQEGDALEDA